MTEPKCRCILLMFRKFPTVEYLDIAVHSACDEAAPQVFPGIHSVNVEMSVSWFDDAATAKTVNANLEQWIATAKAEIANKDITHWLPDSVK